MEVTVNTNGLTQARELAVLRIFGENILDILGAHGWGHVVVPDDTTFHHAMSTRFGFSIKDSLYLRWYLNVVDKDLRNLGTMPYVLGYGSSLVATVDDEISKLAAHASPDQESNRGEVNDKSPKTTEPATDKYSTRLQRLQAVITICDYSSWLTDKFFPEGLDFSLIRGALITELKNSFAFTYEQAVAAVSWARSTMHKFKDSLDFANEIDRYAAAEKAKLRLRYEELVQRRARSQAAKNTAAAANPGTIIDLNKVGHGPNCICRSGTLRALLRAGNNYVALQDIRRRGGGHILPEAVASKLTVTMVEATAVVDWMRKIEAAFAGAADPGAAELAFVTRDHARINAEYTRLNRTGVVGDKKQKAEATNKVKLEAAVAKLNANAAAKVAAEEVTWDKVEAARREAKVGAARTLTNWLVAELVSEDEGRRRDANTVVELLRLLDNKSTSSVLREHLAAVITGPRLGSAVMQPIARDALANASRVLNDRAAAAQARSDADANEVAAAIRILDRL